MKKRAAGFTLLEIMVVLIVIGTLMAIAIPRVNNFLEVSLKSTIRKMGGAILFCFNESVIKQTPLRLNFNLETGEYYLTYMRSTGGQTAEFVELPSEIVQREQLPDNVFIKDIQTPHASEKKDTGEEFINFFPTGFVEQAVIHIGARDGRIFTILVKPLTGKVVVYDREVDFQDLSPQSANFGGSSGGGIAR